MSRLHVYHFVVYKIDYPETLLEGCTYLVKDKEIKRLITEILCFSERKSENGSGHDDESENGSR